VLRPIYRKTFRKQQEKFILQNYLDDLQIIHSIRGDDFLRENPVDHTPGVVHFYEKDGFSANFRWLRYIYLAKRILDLEILGSNSVWLDIGSYYGGLQGLIRKYNPDVNIILVDFHHQLCRSYIYLKSLYPNSKHIFPNQLEDLKNFLSAHNGCFCYVPASEFFLLKDLSVDLATNFFSFGEMKREFFADYFYSDVISNSRYMYLVNRFVSSPWYEPTYDSDLSVSDYFNENREIEYFDVFPMHHYHTIYRNLFGRPGFRNTSSSYFELISKPK